MRQRTKDYERRRPDDADLCVGDNPQVGGSSACGRTTRDTQPAVPVTPMLVMAMSLGLILTNQFTSVTAFTPPLPRTFLGPETLKSSLSRTPGRFVPFSSTPPGDLYDNNNDGDEDETYNLDGYASDASSNSGDDDVEKTRMSKRQRIKAKFGDLFSGMPSVGEILGSSGAGDGRDSSSSTSRVTTAGQKPTGKTRKRRQNKQDYSWFEEEEGQIMDNYQQILQNMLSELAEQRQEDPEAVPDNAEALIKTVLKEEMETEIEATRDKRAQERIKDYEEQLRSDTESSDVSGPPNEAVQKLIDDSEDEYRQREASRLQVEEFLKYEEEAFQKAVQEPSNVVAPESGSNLDQWALERLEDMAKSREGSEGEEVILDILEENVNDLRDRMEKEAKKGSIEPKTMKEWQMYRAIATRQALDESSGVSENDEDQAAREQRILDQLESWKGYIVRETSIRKDSGLARGPKLPFEWQESDLEKSKQKTTVDKRSRSDVRKEINRMSIEALESLLRSSDPQRREKLQQEIDFLKSALEARDYLDVEEEDILEEIVGPVDLSDVFTKSSDEKPPEDKFSSTQSELAESYQQASPSVQPPNTAFFSGTDGQAGQPPTPPSTPFFSEDDVGETASRPLPNTPFFSESDESSLGDVAAKDSKLGGMDEQKLQAMYRRAGVRSDEEQARIKEEWVEFQKIEQEKRKQSGLSSNADDETTSLDAVVEGKDLKYNVSEVLREDGDFDAEKVLASIGPRPTRSKKGSASLSDSATRQETSGDGNPPPFPQTDTPLKSSVQDNEIRDSLYRAVSAVGGGRYKDDPDAKAEQQATFEEFLQKEEEMRQSLDNLEESKLELDLDDSDVDVDDVEYAEEVISSLGPRPKPKRPRIVDEGEFSDQGGILASKDEEEDDDDDDDAEGALGGMSVWESMPDWLRKEKEQDRSRSGESQGRFLGSEIDEMFDDDQYDKNMRQLHEYEQRRAGRQRQMGIDISDVLGRRAYETDDYADYKYDDDSLRIRQSGGWADASFYSRKKNLLEYTELDLPEVNSLMDLKDSPYSTGVSRYLPRINKPFKEFGAIFRLEGVLVDVTGLQLKAWRSVAEEFGFKPPELDDVGRASVIRPEVAVKGFGWTDDFLLCRQVAMAHRKAFGDVFDAWTKEKGIEPPASPANPAKSGSLLLGEEYIGDAPDVIEQVNPDGETKKSIGSSTIIWNVLAEAFQKPTPSEEEIFHAASLSPATAIRAAFKWSDDPSEIDQIAEAYNQYMETGSLPTVEKTDGNAGRTSDESDQFTADNDKQQQVLDKNAIMELHYFAWSDVAKRYNFEAPSPEEVMAAFVINDPEVVVSEGFGWTSDPQETKNVARAFKSTLRDCMQQNSQPGSSSENLETNDSDDQKNTDYDEASRFSSSQEKILETQLQAWTKTAEAYGFPAPNTDFVLLAQKTEPAEAIARLLCWTSDKEHARDIAMTYIRFWEDLSRDRDLEIKVPVPAQKLVEPRSGPTQDEIFRAVFDSWAAVANDNGFAEPDVDQVQFALSVGPDEAIVTGFQWADDAPSIQKLVESYKREIGIRRQQWSSSGSGSEAAIQKSEEAIQPFTVTPHVAEWVKSLLDVEMRCCVVSYLERYQADVLLDLAGLSDLFGMDCRVSGTNGYTDDKQQLLGAALRCERRPDHCVLFDTSPYSSIAAHDVDMRSVNIIGIYPRYELLASDSTTNSLNELSAMNIRRLFGERVYDQPLLETQQAQPTSQKKTKTQYWDED